MRALALLLLAAAPWKQVDTTDGLELYERELPGERVVELKVVTVVKGNVETLCSAAFGGNTVDPREPGVTSRKVLASDAGFRVAYEQVSTPIVSDRDYAVMTTKATLPNGTCVTHFEAANQYAPEVPPRFVRIEKLRGDFAFEPAPGGSVVCTYTVFTDPAGALPAVAVEGPRKKTAVKWMKLVLTRAAEAMDAGR